MRVFQKSFVSIGLVWLGLAPAFCQSAEQKLEQGLIQAMSLNAKTGERLAEPGPALRAYIQAGVVKAKPERREDYTDYRTVRKPAYLYGQQLVELEEEYLTKFIGCCVSEGLGASLKITDPQRLGELQAFAKSNGCKLDASARVAQDLKGRGAPVGQGAYANISCRVRDAN
jgi:hypothetical protein